MSPTLIVILFLCASLVVSVLVVSAAALSSQLSQDEGIEERPLPEPDATEFLQRFPRSS